MFRKIRNAIDRIAIYYGITSSLKESYQLYLLKKGKRNSVSIRSNGKTIFLRNNGIDLEVFMATFGDGFHRCPVALQDKPTIVDLGSNIGLTLIDFKNSYPNARLIGVELDPANFSVLEKNTRQLSTCEVLNAGIWRDDGEVYYEDSDAQSFRIVKQEAANTKKIRSISMDTFFKQFSLDNVDYLKMDIEGAEYEVLHTDADLQWLKKVKLINVEFHPDGEKSIESRYALLKNILESRGFKVYKSALHWSSLIAFNQSF